MVKGIRKGYEVWGVYRLRGWSNTKKQLDGIIGCSWNQKQKKCKPLKALHWVYLPLFLFASHGSENWRHHIYSLYSSLHFHGGFMNETTLDPTLNSIMRPPSLKSFQNHLFSESPLIPEQSRQPKKYKHIIYIFTSAPLHSQIYVRPNLFT